MEYHDPKYDQPNFNDRPLFPKMGLQLHCPKCEHEIVSDDINIDRGLAKCKNCNNVFTFEQNLRSAPLRKRKEVLMPEEVEIDEYEDEMTIFYKWRKAKGISPFFIFFGLVWNGFLIPFILAAIASGTWQILLGISLHVMVGIGFLVFILSRLMNTTYITVDDYELSIEHRPIAIPYFHKNQYYDVRAIEQLYAKKYVSHTTNGVPVHAYAVVAKFDNGEELEIIKGLKSKNKALFIEQEIEIFLGMKDKKTTGEV